MAPGRAVAPPPEENSNGIVVVICRRRPVRAEPCPSLAAEFAERDAPRQAEAGKAGPGSPAGLLPACVMRGPEIRTPISMPSISLTFQMADSVFRTGRLSVASTTISRPLPENSSTRSLTQNSARSWRAACLCAHAVFHVFICLPKASGSRCACPRCGAPRARPPDFAPVQGSRGRPAPLSPRGHGHISGAIG